MSQLLTYVAVDKFVQWASNIHLDDFDDELGGDAVRDQVITLLKDHCGDVSKIEQDGRFNRNVAGALYFLIGFAPYDEVLLLPTATKRVSEFQATDFSLPPVSDNAARAIDKELESCLDERELKSRRGVINQRVKAILRGCDIPSA